MKLQYQLANGVWIDCKNEDGDRTEEFLSRCVENSKGLTRDEVLEKLECGTEMRNHSMDWYSVCRCTEAQGKIMDEMFNGLQTKMVTCACGCTVPEISVMTTSSGSSCPDCYDNMSDY